MEEIELEYFDRGGVPTWGRAGLTTVHPYQLEFADIPEGRKRRRHEYFSGFAPTISYAGFQAREKKPKKGLSI